MFTVPSARARMLFAGASLVALGTTADSAGAQAARPAAARAAATPSRVTSVEGITEYRLANGLRVLLFPDPSKPTVTVNITYLVGSRHEAYGETGMAHLLEHLVFKGTPKHRNIPQELTAHGTRPNGTTWYDRTNYYETMPASDSNLVWALDLEADRMVNSFIAKKDLESEFSVVRNEFESGENDPSSVLLERVISTAFLWHNYGNSTIGARADIENVPIERLQAFYRRYYQPDNAVLVVAGKFDEARTLRLIQQKFGPIPKPVRALDRGNLLFPTYTAEPVQDGERAVTLRRVGDVQVATVVYHMPPGSHPDFAAVDVMTRVLGDVPSGRLYKALVEPKKAASTGAFNFQLREPGILIGTAQVRKEQSLDSASALLVSAIEGLVTQPVTAAEVDRAKTTLLKNFELTLNSSQRLALELSEWTGTGDWRLFFIHRDRLRNVTADDVNRVAKLYLKSSNRTLGQFIPTEKPDRAEMPPLPNVAAMVESYKGDTAGLARGEAFDPSPANIEKRTTRRTLANGFETALLPKQTRGGTVYAQIDLRYGTAQSLAGRGTAGSLLASMLSRGTTKLTRQQFKDSLDKLKARVAMTSGGNFARVTIETTRPNLLPTLALVAEAARTPALDQKEFDQLKESQLANIEEQRSEPTAVGQILFARVLNPWPAGHVNYVQTFDEQVANIKATTLADVRKFHADFYGASHGTMAVVGDFDAPAVQQWAEASFGGWKSPQPFERVAVPFRASTATDTTVLTPDKANALFIAGTNIEIRDDDPDYPALALANYMLGGGFLNSRLATRIRQKEGISYSVGSGVTARPLDRSGQWQAFAIYAPENVARLEAAFREELDKVMTNGFTAEELNAARSGYLQQRLQTRASDNSLVAALSNQLYVDRTMAFDEKMDARIEALTPAEVSAAMKKYVDPAKLIVVKAGDFKKATP